MRKCCKCGCDDYPVVEGFEPRRDKKTLRESLQPITSHWVRIDMYFLEKVRPLSFEEKRAGFDFKMADGKPAKWRFLCTDCFSLQEQTKEYRRAYEEEKAKRADDSGLKNSLFVQEFQLNTE